MPASRWLQGLADDEKGLTDDECKPSQGQTTLASLCPSPHGRGGAVAGVLVLYPTRIFGDVGGSNLVMFLIIKKILRK